MASPSKLLKAAAYLAGSLGALGALATAYLYIDAHRDRDAWFAQRHGELVTIEIERLNAAAALVAERVNLRSDSGLEVTLRVLRPHDGDRPLPVLMLLGGRHTGADAVELFDSVDNVVIVALDYPYTGTQDPRGILEKLAAVPALRRAFLDTAPAISLAADWVLQQTWANPDKLMVAGVSLGVPFAATAAARDTRIAALMLVHGVADNRAWARHNLPRRVRLGPLLGPASIVANWFAYGPLHDTARHVAMLAPRPVIIVGATRDERSPPGQTALLYAAAGEPRKLLWTEGSHVQPGRRQIVDELLIIAKDELQAMELR